MVNYNFVREYKPILYSRLHVYYWRHLECTGRLWHQTVEVSQRTIQIGKVVIGRTFTVNVLKFFTPFLRAWKLFLAHSEVIALVRNLTSWDITIRSIDRRVCTKLSINPLTPNDHYMGRTAQLTYRRRILFIYSTNKRTEYFKHAA